MDQQKPKHFLILKIIGLCAIALLVYAIILAITGFGDLESNRFMIGAMLTPFSLFIGITCTLAGFRPEIVKMRSKSMKYIQQENKQDLTEVASNTADILSGAVSKTAQAIQEGFEGEKMYCKYCGLKIGSDSKFCNHCGREQ